MTLLTLDPSSTAIGYSVWEHRKLQAAGIITPAAPKATPIQRALNMALTLAELVDDTRPDVIVVECPFDTIPQRRTNVSAQQQAFGVYVGRIDPWCVEHGATWHSLHPATWTRCKKKELRTARIRATYPCLADLKDPGGDAADAVGIGEWWTTVRDIP